MARISVLILDAGVVKSLISDLVNKASLDATKQTKEDEDSSSSSSSEEEEEGTNKSLSGGVK